VTVDDSTTCEHFGRWEREFAADGGCSHPIGLRSRTDMIDTATGELAPLYREVPVACGNRREAVCPSCSAVYKRAARQLVRAGLAGGKGIPETITGHPCVFATLTGPVHARRMRGKTVLPCRPRRDAKTRRCPHGQAATLAALPIEHDGQALTLTFGTPQGTDVRPIRRDDVTGTGKPLNHRGPGRRGLLMNRRCGQRCCTSLLYAACKRPVPRWEPAADLGALGGTRTPNLLIRRLCHAHHLPAHSIAELPKQCSLVRIRWQR